MSMMKTCSLIVAAGAVALMIYSFFIIFQGKQRDENDLNVIQRQIRGFALLMLTNILAMFLYNFCSGGHPERLMDMFQ